MENKLPIGILGGTFDPIHNGHIQIAEEILTLMNWDRIEFIPNRRSPLRTQPLANTTHRLAMLHLALRNHPKLKVNELEVHRPAPSYTIDTLKILRAQNPKHPLVLILGSDAFNDFHQWYQWEQILNYAHLLIIARAHNPLDHNQSWMEKLLKTHQTQKVDELKTYLFGKIYFALLKPIAISATEVRKKIQESKDLANFLPSEIYLYIKNHQLY